MENKNQHSLGECLLMDGVGVATYIIPGLGEGFDLIWAFVAGIIFYKWCGSKVGTVGAIAEELLPSTDIIPSFTIGYFVSKD